MVCIILKKYGKNGERFSDDLPMESGNAMAIGSVKCYNVRVYLIPLII